MITNLPTIQETWVQSLGWEDPLEKRMATHLVATVYLPGETHGQKILEDYSPWDHKELDTTKLLTHTKYLVSNRDKTCTWGSQIPSRIS